MAAEKRRVQRLATVGGAVIAVFAPAPVLAHVEGTTSGGFVDGVLHPVLGIDHLVAMVAIGVLAALLRRPLVVPGAFLVGLLAGAGVGLAGGASPLGESAIALSVLALGVALAGAATSRADVAVPVAVAAAAVAGALHGNAHGLEAPATRPAVFVAGFVVATVVLHLAGGAVGVGVRTRPALRSAVAGAVAAAGLGLVAGLA